MTIDIALRKKLAELVTCHIQQNTIDQEIEQPYIWFIRESQQVDSLIDGTHTLATSTFLVECVSDDITEAIELSDSVKVLEGFSDWIDDIVVNLITIEDVSDDYLPRNYREGINISSLRMTLIHHTP